MHGRNILLWRQMYYVEIRCHVVGVVRLFGCFCLVLTPSGPCIPYWITVMGKRPEERHTWEGMGVENAVALPAKANAHA